MRRGLHWKYLSLLGAVLGSLLGVACGGGGGGSTAPKVTVSVSPGAVTLVVNGTQTFSAVVTGAKGVSIASSNGAVRANNVVTITTTSALGLAVGQLVSVAGVTDISFDGTFAVTAVLSPTSFTYTQTGPDASSGSGTVTNISVKWFVNDVEGGDPKSSFGTITTGGLYTAPPVLPSAITATIASTSGAVRSSNVVTITTTAAHNFLVGQTVLISGVADASFNGTFGITSVPSATTFTYNQSGANVTSSGGTVSSVAVKVKAVSIADSTASATAVVNLDSGITVSVNPPTATVGTNETFQFVATVSGSLNNNVNWFVSDVPGGNSTFGMITASGLYTAPASPPSSITASITSTGAVRASNSANIASTGAVRASNTVTITTTAAHGFQVGQSVTIAGVADSSFNGNFTIASVPSTTTFTYAQTGPAATSGGGTATTALSVVTITTTAAHGFQTGQGVVIAGVADSSFNGNFTITSVPTTTTFTYLQSGPAATSGGGTATSASSTVAIKAVAVVDPSRFATASVTVATVADPTLTFINPTHAAQGALFQDVFLTGDHFLSTSTVRFNGTLVPATAVSSKLLRARVPDSILATAATISVDVLRQNGATSTAQSFTIEPVRPALVGTAPESLTQGSAGAALDFNVNGGYFGTNASPAVTAEVEGSVRTASVSSANSARQLIVTLTSTDVATPGLLPIGVRNSFAAPPLAAANLAVRPAAFSIPATPLVASLPVGTKPDAVAINTATGTAVVANHDSNDLTLIDLTQSPPAVSGSSIPVGKGPTGVAVDNVRNLAVVVNNTDNSVSIVDLSSRTVTSTITGGSGTALGVAPLAVGVNPLTGRALVVNQTTNLAEVLDLTASPPAIIGTAAISTGTVPAVAVEPKLNWAIVTPGGAGTLSIVDLGHSTPPVPPATLPAFNVVATATVGTGVQGVAISPETELTLLTNPAGTALLMFSALDQAVTSLQLERGHVAAAFNPLIDIGVTVNSTLNEASIIDPRTPQRLVRVPVGTAPAAVAVDPGSNLAVVVNQGSNDITILSLGPIRPLHITQVNLPLSAQLNPTSTLTSGTDLPITVYGKGFVSGSLVRLDDDFLPAPSNVSDRQLSVTIPAATLLASPRRFALRVENPGGAQSNVAELTVAQAVDMTGPSCTAPAPQAVAVDPELNLAVATNSGCDNVALIDLSTGTVKNTIAVGTQPQGVAVISRLAKAVVANRGSNDASIVKLDTAAVTNTVAVGSEPVGVGIDPSTGLAVVTNSNAATVSLVNVDTGFNQGNVAVDQRPVAVGIDPVHSLAAVANSGSNTIALLNLTQGSPLATRVFGFQLPTSVAFDPVTGTGLFLVTASLINNLVTLDPATHALVSIKVGINPTSVAYNFASSTLVTLNTASNTISVVDFLSQRVRAVVGLPGSGSSSVDIHPRTNLAVVADSNHNRVLLVPLPR